MRKLTFVIAAAFAVCAFASAVSAYQIPWEDSNVKEFYVVGKDGDPLMGDRKSGG